MLRRLVLALAFILGVAWSQDRPLLLKPTDVLQVTVFAHPEYSGEYTIQSDGAIYATGVGRVTVSGKTVETVQRIIQNRLGAVLMHPYLSVILKTERRLVVFVTGGTVMNLGGSGPTGVVPYDASLDLRKVFAQAGKLDDYDELTVTVFRNGVAIHHVDPAKLMRGVGNEWDGPLQPDDVIVINPAAYARAWVLGSVRHPSEVKLKEGEDVYQAIALAGDFDITPTGTAQPGETNLRVIREDFRITIRRGPDTIPVPTTPKPSAAPIVIEPGDTIYVQETPKIRVSVMGEVNRPGEQVINAGGTLPTAISGAGGPTAQGTIRNVFLYRRGEMYTLDALNQQGNYNMATKPLEAGDVIVVPENKRAFYVFGEVISPGRKLMDDKRRIYLADAISAANGLNARGTNRRMVLLRPDKTGKMVATQYNFDEYTKDGNVAANPEIEPGDVVYVSTPRGVTLGTALEVASAALIVEGVKNGVP
jgi:protein involved in polysaccharide export with SLBB domain